MDFSPGMSGRPELLDTRERSFAEEINKPHEAVSVQQWCDQTSGESGGPELFYNVLHPYYPLRFLTTNRSQNPVFLAKFSSMVRMRLSKSDICWLAHQKKKDSHKCMRWTEKVFFRQAVKL